MLSKVINPFLTNLTTIISKPNRRVHVKHGLQSIHNGKFGCMVSIKVNTHKIPEINIKPYLDKQIVITRVLSENYESVRGRKFFPTIEF